MNRKQLIGIGILILCMQLSFSGCKPVPNRYHLANFENDKVVELFANKFKAAVIKNEREKVASMVLYPINAMFKDKAVIIHNSDEFLRLYDRILDKDLIKKISKLGTHNMFANYQGVMLGDGEVWFGTSCAKCKDIKVVAVGPCRRFD